MKVADYKQRLRELLKERSLKFGEFTLVSGKKSNYYFDSKLTSLSAEGSYLIGKVIFDLIKEHNIEADYVGGITLGADPIVTAVALVSHLEGEAIDAFIVRKETKGHGTKRAIEGLVAAGKKAIIIEDVVTTGGSTMKAIEAAKDHALEISAIVALVDRLEGGSEVLKEMYPYYSVFTRIDLGVEG